MKKAFTLVELIAVIAILGLIALIVYPSINSVIKSAKDDSYESQTKVLEKAAREWSLDNINLLPKDEVTVVCVSQLIEGGYLSNEDVKDPRDTSKDLMGGVEISYKSGEAGDYVYKYNDKEKTCSGKTVGMKVSRITNSDDGVVLENQDGYYKGSNPNNYLDYGNKEWRILRVNEDGSLKMISNEGVRLSVTDTSFKDSSLSDYLNTSFYNSIGKNKNISKESYCLNYENGCLEEDNLKVTVMNLNDLVMASNNLNCSESNLEACYKGNYLLDYSANNGTEYTLVADGSFSLNKGTLLQDNSETKNVRPVVTLSNFNILKGNGTERNPYVAV